MKEASAHRIIVEVSEETLERLTFLAEQERIPVVEMASKLLADEAEAQSGLARGPFLRKYMHR